MSVDAICALFGKTRQSYYQRLGYQYQEAAEESIILDLIAELRKDMGRMGGRKLWHEINEAHPGMISRDKLFDILDKYHLKVHRRKRTVRTTWSASWLHRFPNLVKDLILTAANQVWVSDITYIETEAGFVYLHLVTDAYSKKIMGWCLSPSLHADATISALQMAIRNAGCDLKGLIHHSDRGCQYCCEKYVKLLQDNGIEISMTQDGNPRDNAIAERVNGILKTMMTTSSALRMLTDELQRS
ncbi:MAG: IS3 family transposase [Bacteroidales bacterium]|nr:IS3 family transposase [Bacteroidales bacterium]